jgi:hypothetical protein
MEMKFGPMEQNVIKYRKRAVTFEEVSRDDVRD